MRRRLALVSTALLLTLSACGGSDPADTDDRAADTTSAPSASASSSAATGAAAPAPSSAAPGGNGASAAPTAQGGTTAAATAAPRRTAVTVPSAAGPADTTQATAAGDYTYDSEGTVTFGGRPQPAEGVATLTVDEASGDAQHSVLSSDQNRTEQDVLLRANGTYVSRVQLTNPAFDKTFEPEPAPLLVPDPADVGDTWAWTATSTDGKTTLKQSSKVLRAETLTISGKKVETRVIETRLVVSGDGVDYRATLTTWYAPAFHLPVKEHQKGSGTVSGFAFASDVTATVRSTTPA